MAKELKLDISFAFFKVLQDYYRENRGKVRRNYTDLTRKFLNYNDPNINPKAFLRGPQFEALEMYVFIKEFFGNRQVSSIFEDFMEQKGNFANTSFYSHNDGGQISILDHKAQDNKVIFDKMKKVSEIYPNYIYALTMGLGKTILMATCIFYEFLVANKNPKDKRFCHNAIVFAPDKTVLESLREIMTFDKALVVPTEYARILDANIKFHFLEDTGTTLNTLDNSDFNIIISNTQKIIVKKKKKKDAPADMFFNLKKGIDNSSVMGEALNSIFGDDMEDEELEAGDLIYNQRFRKLCRLKQIGIYVDEAHHLFGTELENSIRNNSVTSLRNTINLLAKQLQQNGSSVVACYNYTGTPYVKNEILPEVVYAYGLKDSINNGYLKDADILAYENVKSEEFLKDAIGRFWNEYKDKTYEGLTPKLAIFGADINEVDNEIRPIVEKTLAGLGIPLSKILVNVGDNNITKENDLLDFNNLDNVGTTGNEKQFILLVNKGREGWNCRSLFGVALFRSPSSKVFVLQSTMRCLRHISEEQQTAKIFLSKENFDILDNELAQNFHMSISDMKKEKNKQSQPYEVRVVPPKRYINIKAIRHEYTCTPVEYSHPVDFKLSERDYSKYEAVIYEKHKFGLGMTVKTENIDDIKENVRYSIFTLAGEIARYLNEKCVLIAKILRESIDGVDLILDKVNLYNELVYDVIIPEIFNCLYEISVKAISFDKKICLLNEPKKGLYYTRYALPELVITKNDDDMQKYVMRSFHADTYCFDSKPEKECFLQYISNEQKVEKIYFTGMFTSNEGELAIPYYDPESKTIRNYYPDFLAEMKDGTLQLIEVKGDNMIDDLTVKAKAEAAKEVAVESSMEYKIYTGKYIMKYNVLEKDITVAEQINLMKKS